MTVDVGVAPGNVPSLLEGRIAEVRTQVAEACRAAGRDPGDVRIVAVTKAQTRATVLAAVAAGIGDIGENYVQEARPKLEGLTGVRKHFLGHVQTNKAKPIVATFDVVQSIDRLDAGLAIAAAARATGRPLTMLVQVNVSPTERYGVAPSEAEELATRLRAAGLVVDGVMAIGPAGAGRDDVLRAFERAAAAFGRVGGDTLSLGMSGDWREAVESGATLLRLGTALFGPRGGVPAQSS
jgi:pyridoxal phosphate enzyme (YggS family)